MSASTSPLLPRGRIPIYAHVADLDKKISGRRHRNNAIKAPYVQVNPKDRIYNMIFDLDCDTAVLDWLDGVPILPAYFVGRRRQGLISRPHAVIKLRIPVDLTKWKQASLYFAIRGRIKELLEFEGCVVDDGDKHITKNPNCRKHWSVKEGDNRLWTLNELREALGLPDPDEVDRSDLQTVYRRAGEYCDLDNASLGRNCNMFEAMRGLAYLRKAHCATEEQLYEYVLRECEDFDALNNPYKPQRPSEIRATAKSIAHWTWCHYTGSGQARDINYGACAAEISPEMTLKERQAVGGRHGVRENARKHEDAVREAIAGRDDYTIKGLARELSMAVNTVRKYLRQIEAEARPATPEQRLIRLPEKGVKIVSSEIGEGQICPAPAAEPRPDFIAEAAGYRFDLWSVPYDDGLLENANGALIPKHYLEPYIIWASSDLSLGRPPAKELDGSILPRGTNSDPPSDDVPF